MLKQMAQNPSAGIAAGTLASRLLGVARNMLLVTAIGSTGVWANSFATANQIPNSIYTLIATGAISSVLVPQIAKAMASREHGQRYVNRLLTLTLVLATVACVLTLPLPRRCACGRHASGRWNNSTSCSKSIFRPRRSRNSSFFA